MRKAPAYIMQNRHGMFYVRIIIPETVRHCFTHKRDIKRSLKTHSRQEAIKLARAYRVELDRLFDQLMDNTKKKPVTIQQDFITILHPLTGLKLQEIDFPNDPDREQAEAEKIRAELRQDVNALLRDNPALLTHQPAQASPPRLILSAAIQEYLSGQTGKGVRNDWEPKTKRQVEATLRDFLEIVRDKPVANISRQDITTFANQIIKLPARRNSLPQYKGKSISEVLEMIDIAPVDPSTARNALGRISTFFKWLKVNQLIDTNPAEAIISILPKQARKKNKITAREPFTAEELKTLFHSPTFAKPRYPYQYWLPLIALYSGARLEEICKLQLSDLKESGGVHYFQIDDAKTEAGNRNVPFHNKLIELGLLDYIKQLRVEGKSRLFPELKKDQYGKYGDAAGDWFARYNKRHGIIDGKKTFHSFRHTVANFYKQRFENSELRDALLGHEDKVAHGTYGTRYTPEALKPYVDKLEYELDIPDWKSVSRGNFDND